MSRKPSQAVMLKKLASAVKDYRGSYNPNTGAWVKHPKPKAERRVRRWLERLGLPVDLCMVEIRALKSYPEFRGWLLGVTSVLRSREIFEFGRGRNVRDDRPTEGTAVDPLVETGGHG